MPQRLKPIIVFLAALIAPFLTFLFREVLAAQYSGLPRYVLYYPIVLLIAVFGNA